MIGRHFLLNTTAIAIALVPGLLRADIVLNSVAGLDTCMFNTAATSCGLTGDGVTTTGETVAITPHPSWEQQVPTLVNPDSSIAPNSPIPVWIGAVASGYGDGTFVPTNFVGGDPSQQPTTPVYQISESFATGGDVGTLYLNVWADDSVDVFLAPQNVVPSISNEISPPASNQQNPPCSGTEVSCTPLTLGNYTETLAANTTYTLTFNVWQTGPGGNSTSNPTGLLYTGGLHDATIVSTNVSTPEAGVVSTLLTMLIGLAAFAGIFKKKLA